MSTPKMALLSMMLTVGHIPSGLKMGIMYMMMLAGLGIERKCGWFHKSGCLFEQPSQNARVPFKASCVEATSVR